MFRFLVVLACLFAVAQAMAGGPKFGVKKAAPVKQAAPAPVAATPVKKSGGLSFGAKKSAPSPAPAAPVKKAAPASSGVKKSSVVSFGVKKSAPSPAPAKKAAPAPAPAPTKKAAPVKKAASAPVKRAAAPAPAPFVASGSFAYGLAGADVEAGEFDPLGFSKQVDEKTVQWYRAAELKHGRVCMAAALGLLFAPTNAQFHWIPDSLFEEQSGLKALDRISAERPEAILQILTALAAVEVLSLFRSADGAAGDLGWDPLDFKTKYAADQDKLALRELKNGRLAMLMVPGILVQEFITGKGVFEA